MPASCSASAGAALQEDAKRRAIEEEEARKAAEEQARKEQVSSTEALGTCLVGLTGVLASQALRQ